MSNPKSYHQQLKPDETFGRPSFRNSSNNTSLRFSVPTAGYSGWKIWLSNVSASFTKCSSSYSSFTESLIVVIIAGYPSSWMRVPVSLLIVCYNKMYTCAWVYYLLRQLLCILFVYGCRLLSCLSSSSYDYCCYCHVLAAPALETMSIYRCTVYIYFCVF
jgi:hypothetical protein